MEEFTIHPIGTLYYMSVIVGIQKQKQMLILLQKTPSNSLHLFWAPPKLRGGANSRTYNDQKHFDIGMPWYPHPLLLEQKWTSKLQMEPPSSKGHPAATGGAEVSITWCSLLASGTKWEHLEKLSVSRPHDLYNAWISCSYHFRPCITQQPVFGIRWHSNLSNPCILSAAYPVRKVSFIVSYYSFAPMWSCSCGCGSFGCRSRSTSLQIFSKMDCFFPSFCHQFCC